MKKFAVLLVLASGALGGCGHLVPYDGADPTKPLITFEQVKGADAIPQFAVTPRELVFKQRGEVKITWTIDKNSNLRFVEKFGVEIVGEIKDVIAVRPISSQSLLLEPLKERSQVLGQQFRDLKQDEVGECNVSQDRLTATCTNHHTRAGIFKYSLRLTDDQSGNEFILDPRINNW